MINIENFDRIERWFFKVYKNIFSHLFWPEVDWFWTKWSSSFCASPSFYFRIFIYTVFPLRNQHRSFNEHNAFSIHSIGWRVKGSKSKQRWNCIRVIQNYMDEEQEYRTVRVPVTETVSCSGHVVRLSSKSSWVQPWTAPIYYIFDKQYFANKDTSSRKQQKTAQNYCHPYTTLSKFDNL